MEALGCIRSVKLRMLTQGFFMTALFILLFLISINVVS